MMNTKSRRKLVPQLRCSLLKRAVCDLETGVNWSLEGIDRCIYCLFVCLFISSIHISNKNIKHTTVYHSVD